MFLLVIAGDAVSSDGTSDGDSGWSGLAALDSCNALSSASPSMDTSISPSVRSSSWSIGAAVVSCC